MGEHRVLRQLCDASWRVGAESHVLAGRIGLHHARGTQTSRSCPGCGSGGGEVKSYLRASEARMSKKYMPAWPLVPSRVISAIVYK